MPTQVLKITRPINPGVFTLQVPGGVQILSVDSTGIVLLKPTGATLPDEPRTFEIVDPGGTLTDDDPNKYVHLGSVGDRQVFERALD